MKANKQIITLIGILVFLVSCADGPSGEKTYQKKCANCHGKEGEGLKKLIPPLAGSDFLINKKTDLPCIIKNGLKDTIVVNGHVFFGEMPANKELSVIEISNLVNYIIREWGDGSYQSEQDIRTQLEKCD